MWHPTAFVSQCQPTQPTISTVGKVSVSIRFDQKEPQPELQPQVGCTLY